MRRLGGHDVGHLQAGQGLTRRGRPSLSHFETGAGSVANDDLVEARGTQLSRAATSGRDAQRR